MGREREEGAHQGNLGPIVNLAGRQDVETKYLHGRWTERKANRIEIQGAREKGQTASGCLGEQAIRDDKHAGQGLRAEKLSLEGQLVGHPENVDPGIYRSSQKTDLEQETGSDSDQRCKER